MQGMLYLGYGDEYTEADLKAYPAGNYVLVPANARHFDGSLEDTLIIGTAVGCWATYYVNLEHQASAGTPKDAV